MPGFKPAHPTRHTLDIFLGCGGNGNRFNSEEECLEKCGSDKKKKLEKSTKSYDNSTSRVNFPLK